MIRKTTDWIQTFCGHKFYPLEPEHKLIQIEDIAHALSMQCRFSGHTKQFYSVAQHSCLLADIYFSDNPALARYALLHDASEAYLSDVPRPLKILPDFWFYRNAERKLQALIYECFGLNPDEPIEVKQADAEILYEEAKELMSPIHEDWIWHRKPEGKLKHIEGLMPHDAEIGFLSAFHKLFGGNQ